MKGPYTAGQKVLLRPDAHQLAILYRQQLVAERERYPDRAAKECVLFLSHVGIKAPLQGLCGLVTYCFHRDPCVYFPTDKRYPSVVSEWFLDDIVLEEPGTLGLEQGAHVIVDCVPDDPLSHTAYMKRQGIVLDLRGDIVIIRSYMDELLHVPIRFVFPFKKITLPELQNAAKRA